jgi:hypothetical protein
MVGCRKYGRLIIALHYLDLPQLYDLERTCNVLAGLFSTTDTRLTWLIQVLYLLAHGIAILVKIMNRVLNCVTDC